MTSQKNSWIGTAFALLHHRDVTDNLISTMLAPKSDYDFTTDIVRIPVLPGMIVT